MKTTLRRSFDNLSTAAAKASFALLQMRAALEFVNKKEEIILRECLNRRVAHLARYGKTKRVRMKNMQRAAREFEKKGEIK